MQATKDLLYAAAARTVCGIDAERGHTVWVLKLPFHFFGASISMIMPVDDVLFVARGSHLYCLDRFTGEIRWETETPTGAGGYSYMVLASPVSEPGMQSQATIAAQMQMMQAANAAAMAAAATASSASIS